jgi:hypothetical protein
VAKCEALSRVRGKVSLQSIEYRQQHTFAVGQHIVVPESKDAITLPPKVRIAASIALAFRMLSAIDLDNEVSVAADEVTTNRPIAS